MMRKSLPAAANDFGNMLSLPPDLRPPIFWVVGHYADEATWNALHELGSRTTSIQEKQNYYDTLAAARDLDLVAKTLEISLTDELPTSRALFLVGKVARYSDHPERLGANSYAPSLFTFFSEPSRAAELKAYAKTNLPSTAASAKEVAKAADEVQFRGEFKRRLISQLAAWIDKTSKVN